MTVNEIPIYQVSLYPKWIFECENIHLILITPIVVPGPKNLGGVTKFCVTPGAESRAYHLLPHLKYLF
ncbi:unnamed protein product [Heterobilharzia americana]|nr:unnamed protein product [Heterobilharzia americana]